jgi:hypothetical protein
MFIYLELFYVDVRYFRYSVINVTYNKLFFLICVITFVNVRLLATRELANPSRSPDRGHTASLGL